jgi:hypothetical protein
MTTSPPPLAQRPSVSLSGLKRGCAVSMPKASVGACLPPIGLPFASMSLAESPSLERSMIAPAAASTSGSRLTRSSSEAGTVGVPLDDPLTISRPEITALVSL